MELLALLLRLSLSRPRPLNRKQQIINARRVLLRWGCRQSQPWEEDGVLSVTVVGRNLGKKKLGI
uniref:Uncharacterized protein n=1 Tax=Salix viminalis TaxID=40686 RepID=A0A6N2L0V3_SALVM